MKEEKDILNRDVEIPEVVFRKADAALNQIRANTGSTKATRKVTRIQGRIHHVQAAAVEINPGSMDVKMTVRTIITRTMPNLLKKTLGSILFN